MEEVLRKDLKKIKRLEGKQAVLIGYISSIGKWFLFFLPIALVILSLLIILDIFSDLTLTISFYAVLGVYGINSIILLLGAFYTKKALNKRLIYERKRGRPIDSLDGFDLLANNVQKVINLLFIIALLCLVSLSLFVTMLAIGFVELGYAAIGFALFGFGLALLIRSLKLNIHSVN